jgi:hypothetical protein
MKSYFAKLADRATLPNVPAASMVHSSRVSDPFEESAETASAKITKPKPADVTTPRTILERTQAKADLTPVVATLKTERPSPSESFESRTNLESKTQERELGEKFEPLQPKQTRNSDSDYGSPSTTLIPTIEEPLAPFHSSQKSQEAEESNITSYDRDSPSTDQSDLMRRADAFMARVFANEFRAHDATEPVSKETTVAKFVEAPRPTLNPAQPLQPSSTNDTQGPSLVIGKLNVEVIPPVSPVAPTPERIVVRRYGFRGGGLLPTRRFGLGQS